MNSDSGAEVRAIVYRQLAMRDHSRGQLQKKLNSRGVDPEVASEVLDQFEEAGLVDDASFARTFVERSREPRGLSRRGVTAKLRDAGVDADLVAEAIEAIDDESEYELALDLAVRKARSTRGLDRAVRERRMAGYLARRGFGSSLVFRAVKEALRGDD